MGDTNPADAESTARLPIQLQQGVLIVSVQTDLSLAVLELFKSELLERLHHTRVLGVVIDLQEVRIMDVAEFERLNAIAAMSAVMGAKVLVAGLRPGVVASLVSDSTVEIALPTIGTVDEAIDHLRHPLNPDRSRY